MSFLKKHRVVVTLSMFALLLSGMKTAGQDTLAFYNFDDGNASIFTTGATGIGWAPDGRCSWELGSPSGGQGYSNVRGQRAFIGNNDPTSDYTQDNTANLVVGQGLSTSSKTEGISGHYNNSSEWFQLPVFDFTNYYNIKLSFWQWGNFEPGYDFPFVEISVDEINWNTLYSPATLENTSWEKVTLDLSNYANNENQVYIRWRTQSDKSIFYAGWNIDNVTITGDYSNNDGDSYISLGSITPPDSISSLTDSYAERVSFAEFSITDAGSGDNLPTIIDTLVITQNSINTVSNWKKAISGISIYDSRNTTELLGTVERDRLVFVNPGMFTVNDGESNSYILRLYLKQNLSNISDNDRLGMNLNFADFSVSLSGSLIGSGYFTTDSDQLRIDIDATELRFQTDPEQLVDVNRVLTPLVQVAATDENGNVDADFSDLVTLSNTLNLATFNNSKVAENGIALYNAYYFLETGGPTVLEANDEYNVLNSAISQVSVTISESASEAVFEDNFDNSGVTGWTTGAVTGSSSWETGVPSGGLGYSDVKFQKGYVGNPDPITDYSANYTDYVYGQGLSRSSKTEGISGYYNNSNEWLMSPAINCTDYYNTQLSFWRWANTEADFDKAYLEISTDGTQWVDLGHELYPQDLYWTYQSFDISLYADRQATVYIRWRLESDGTIFYSGWNIDDVSVTGIYSPVTSWTGTNSNDWHDQQNWSTNAVPHNFSSVIIDANTPYTPVISTQDAICKEINIRENAVLEISETGKLEVFGDVTIETNATGYGSLLDLGELSVQGKGIMSRYLSNGKWHYVSSPFQNQNTSIFGSKIFKYNEPVSANNWYYGWELASGETMEIGKGYDVIKYADSEIRMEGEFNTGSITIDLTNTDGLEVPEHEGWNLVGNPYPSAIDWDAASGWAKTNISDAIYIWDEEQQNFVTYVSGVGANGGSNHIPPMQGFFVKVANPGAGSISMNNEVRNLHTSVTLKAGGDYSNELKLKVANRSYSDEMVVRFKTNALKGFDIQLDAEKKFSSNSQVPQIYSLGHETAPLTVNSLPENDEYYKIELFTTLQSVGEHVLDIDGTHNFDFAKTLYLEDLALGELISLEDTDSYIFFTTAPIKDSARFVLHINMPLTISYDAVHASSGQSSDGSIDLTILGGYRPILDIEWSNGNQTEDLNNLLPGYYTVTVTDYYNNTVSETIQIQQPESSSEGRSLTSISSNSENSLVVYEKNGYIQVENPTQLEISKTMLFDLSGKLIYSDNNTQTTSYSIPQQINEGLYIVNLYKKGKIFSRKVVVNQ